MHEFISQYGPTLLYTVLTTLLSYAFLAFKKEVKNFEKMHEKKEVIRTCILGLRHLYKDKTDDEKYDLAVLKIKEIFTLRKIDVSDFEVELLIAEVCEKMDCSHINM